MTMPRPLSERKGMLRAVYNPMEVIQGIIALTLLGFGLYIVSPFFAADDMSATAIAFASSEVQRIVFSMALFIAPAATTLLGFFSYPFRTPLWRARGCFGMTLGLLFITILRLVTIGAIPLTWVFSLTTGLISGVLYLYWHNQ